MRNPDMPAPPTDFDATERANWAGRAEDYRQDRQFDVVLANFVVNHVGQPRAALAELRRVAVPGGRVAVTAWPRLPSPTVALRIDWRLAVEPRAWWDIASGASWVRAFVASQGRALLDKVRDRFDELSSGYRADDGRLCLPVTALLAQGYA